MGRASKCDFSILSDGDLPKRHKLDDLPPTLKYAVHVTRELGFRYLWVDALCIRQDSAEDKAREISRMHQYYLDATMSIQPTGLMSVRDSFLENHTNALCEAAIQSTNTSDTAKEQSTKIFSVPYFTKRGDEDSIILREIRTFMNLRRNLSIVELGYCRSDS